MSAYQGTCWCCKYFWEDFSVGACECQCEKITEEALDKHFTDGEKGCPFYEESKEE